MRHLLAICLLVPVSLVAQPVLAPGVPTPVRLELPEGAERTFLVEVSDDTVSLGIQTLRTTGDLALRLCAGDEESCTEVDTEEPVELLVRSRFDDEGLLPGRHELTVSYVGPGQASGAVVEAQLLLTAVTTSDAATITPGTRTDGVLQAHEGSLRLYRVEVPEGTESLRLDLTGTDADLDLLVGLEGFPASMDEATLRSLATWGTESLVVPDLAPDRPGTVHVVVLDTYQTGHRVPFTLVTTAGAEAPAALDPIPAWETLPAATPALGRALAATVEVFAGDGSGSGTLVGSRGHILTCWHVVRQVGVEAPFPDLRVGIVVDLARPARERFRARLVHSDPPRDLALLEITGTFHGRPLPEGFRFPGLPVERGIVDDLRLGAELHQVGFPAVGGPDSRATVTVTRGILSGFCQQPEGQLLKTDGGIFGGHSGGGSYDSRGRLVGVLSYAVAGEDADQLGFIVPVSMLPEGWLTLLGD